MLRGGKVNGPAASPILTKPSGLPSLDCRCQRGFDQPPLLKISQTRRLGPPPFTDQPLKQNETIRMNGGEQVSTRDRNQIHASKR
jgi:hypothetical protein